MKFSFGDEWGELKKFENLPLDDKKIVFYSENENSMIVFESLIDELTDKYNLDICYVTSSKNESVLMKSKNHVKTFYIGDGVIRTKFFLNLKASIMIMTMPDLESFHIKRSKIHPVHYIYMFHSMVSTHLVYRKSAFDNYDTIFCVGEHHLDEIQNTEKYYNLKPKNLIKYGYGHLDNLIQKYSENNIASQFIKNQSTILLAPSWSNNGISETIGEKIIEILLNDFNVIYRPHPMTQKNSEKKLKQIAKMFSQNKNFRLETDIKNFDSFLESDILITDWSGSALEFSFVFKKPVIFIDVPKKINNPEFDKISSVPIEVKIRNEIGKVISANDLSLLDSEIKTLLSQKNKFQEKIIKIRDELIFNINESKEFGAKAIIELLNKKSSP
jgi:YidC/Oxa1 family membrane protein insertase